MADAGTTPTARSQPRPDKVAAVAEMTDAFRDSSATLLTEYRGLTVAQLTELRRALGTGTTYSVVKNTLTKRAAADAGLSLDDALFTGPTAIAFVVGDPVQATKGLRDFSRAHPLLVIKGAVLDGVFLSPADVRRIADLDSREVLLARMAGALVASLSGAASLFQAPLAQVARLAAALRDKQAEAEPAAGAAPDEAAPESAPETVPASPPDSAAPADDPAPN
ncbi:MAG: 50S ribosomal protein L10 [Actinomycetota bacterium]|nr:50S ribosomal protein L10 [Actinomycetota bacterium]